jgi:hypothetical protein
MGIIEIRDRARDIHQVEPQVLDRMQDDKDFEIAEGRCLIAAVRRYTRDRPVVNLTRVTALGSQQPNYDLATLIPEWDEDSCRVINVQVDLQTNSYETYLDKNDWRYTKDVDTGNPVLRLIRGGLSEDFAIWYELPHKINPDNTTTIPVTDEEPVAWFVAHLALTAAANHYARKAENNTYGADTVKYTSVSKDYNRQAADALQHYVDDVKVLSNGYDACFVTWETGPETGGSWLLHGRYAKGWP